MLVTRKGFTLIELLVSIAVMAVIAATILALIGPSSKQYARDVQRKSDLEQIRSGLELYRNSNSTYPTGNGVPSTVLDSTLRVGSYMTAIPNDPSSGRSYYYQRITTTTFELCADMEKSGYSGSCGGTCGTAACDYRTIQP